MQRIAVSCVYHDAYKLTQSLSSLSNSARSRHLDIRTGLRSLAPLAQSGTYASNGLTGESTHMHLVIL